MECSGSLVCPYTIKPRLSCHNPLKCSPTATTCHLEVFISALSGAADSPFGWLKTSPGVGSWGACFHLRRPPLEASAAVPGVVLGRGNGLLLNSQSRKMELVAVPEATEVSSDQDPENPGYRTGRVDRVLQPLELQLGAWFLARFCRGTVDP